MSTASPPAGRGQPAQQRGPAAGPAQQSGQATQPAGQGPATGQPAPQGQQARGPAPQAKGKGASTPSRSAWSTPRLLRLARAGAATAVLLTGVAATGTFSTDGLNATPDVIAQQWVAAERAGVEMAQADLRAAERVAGSEGEGAREAFDEAVTQVGIDLSGVGVGGAEAGEISREWSTFVLGAERASAAAAQDQGGSPELPDAVTVEYGAASTAARSASERTDLAAEQHAQDLRTGSRSVLTGTVGTLATLGLVGLMVWLALRTRRIVNVPLLAATAITAGLTYLSFNPSALPLTYDQRLADTTAAATALQEVYQARTAQHALTPAQSDLWAEESVQARQAIGAGAARTLWEEIVAATPEPGVEAVTATQENFSELETVLRDRLDDQLSTAVTAVGRPAGITSGVALLLGLVGAGFAWTGLSRRLKEYR
ncbi:hypothetical protein [Ornithinimicrobium pratense]|uniref:Uncharacterized protein n=1 Tax=Ornithinimicrobium pratense TaxID=2593973 RepID=A0A5J6V513_9MICO|nr:hypothetical protein [Ornithinimicrobium pratense]QFG68103.1 hypothetical protein FY030_04685 [Ornithinimicrobium pratense]